MERQIIPLQEGMDGTSSVVASPLPIREREMESHSQISYVDLVSGMRRSKLHRVQHPHVEVGWWKILSWYSEWVMEIVVDPGVVQQEFPSAGNTGTPNWDWDPSETTCRFPSR